MFIISLLYFPFVFFLMSIRLLYFKDINTLSYFCQRRQWQPIPVLLPGKSHGWRSLVGCRPFGAKNRTQLSNFTFTFHFHALEKEMATHSSVLAWRIPGTAEPGGLPSMGSHRVRHDWSDLAAATYFCNYAPNLLCAFKFCLCIFLASEI